MFSQNAESGTGFDRRVPINGINKINSAERKVSFLMCFVNELGDFECSNSYYCPDCHCCGMRLTIQLRRTRKRQQLRNINCHYYGNVDVRVLRSRTLETDNKTDKYIIMFR